ncbi:MAG: hypothetical protein U0232_33770, partial [Thermomicrobiales bacterium]
MMFLVAAMAAGCGESNTTPQCVPGSTSACLCVGAGSGVQVCAASGTFGACVCPGQDAGADGTLPGDAAAPQDVAAPPDNATPADTTVPPDGAQLADAMPSADATPPSPDAPAPMDAVAPDAAPPADAPAPSDVPDSASPPDAAGACSSLPTGPLAVRALDPMTIESSEDIALGFTPAGLLAIGRATSTGGYLRIITVDGFSRAFTTVSLGRVGDVRFLSDTQAVIAPDPTRSGDVDFTVVEPTRRVRSVPMLLSVPRIALDREGGIYYTSGDRLFRTTATGIGPGDFLTAGMTSATAMVINADRS